MIAVVFAKDSVRFPGKHSINLGDTSMIDRVISRVLDFGELEEVVLFTKSRSISTSLCRIEYDNSAPAIAHSLLLAMEKHGDIFAVAGDMPCVSPRIARKMLGSWNGECVVPVHPDGRIEPLFAIYPAKHIAEMRNNLEKGKLSLHEFIRSIPFTGYRIREEDAVSFTNVNTPDALRMLKERGC